MKALLINGSPNEKGGTYTALSIIADSLKEEGIESEILQLPTNPIQGCIGCFACRSVEGARCTFEDDIVNVILEKMEQSDALVLGTPVYYASPNGHLLAALDRVFFAGSAGDMFVGKPASAICTARRAGTTATLDALQKYFLISGMPMVPSNYWPMVHGGSEEEVSQDEEGVQIMQLLGKNLAWMLKCFKAGDEAGVSHPQLPGGRKRFTNFIRKLK
jgi:Multimeric flavodoxin WrbA